MSDMGLIRGLGGVVLSVVAFLLAVVAVILCVTIILLPVGLPLLAYAGRVFALALKWMLPRAVSHPMRTAEKTATKGRRKTAKKLQATRPDFKKFGARSRHMLGGRRKKSLLHR